MESEQKLRYFIEFYEGLSKENINTISNIYTKNILFEDPAHRIQGMNALLLYFNKLYENVTECHFIIENAVINQDIAYLSWQMQFSHPKLAKGSTRTVFGCSQIKFDANKVCYQRDYFDLGAMLYEALPLLGRIIKQIKKRLGQ